MDLSVELTRPGEIMVLKTPRVLSQDQAARLKAHLETALRQPQPIVVLEPGFELRFERPGFDGMACRFFEIFGDV